MLFELFWEQAKIVTEALVTHRDWIWQSVRASKRKSLDHKEANHNRTLLGSFSKAESIRRSGWNTVFPTEIEFPVLQGTEAHNNKLLLSKLHLFFNIGL